MKNKFLTLTCIVMVIAVLAGVALPATAADTRASDYFWCTAAWATPIGHGNFIVEFDVSTTDTMLEVGASRIVIYEQKSSGLYRTAKIFTRYNTPEMIDTNSSCNYCRVSYSGTPGTRYYAVVTFYAKNASGSEVMNMNTKIITP